MATQIKKNNLKNIFVAFKNRKKNPDWARVEEPDVILKNFEYVIYGIVITAFTVLLTWGAMSVSPIEWVAEFLVAMNTSALPFEQVYAAFGAAVIILINVVVTVIFLMIAPASNDDIIEMISDLDANIQERLVETDNNVNTKLEEFGKRVDDLTTGK